MPDRQPQMSEDRIGPVQGQQNVFDIGLIFGRALSSTTLLEVQLRDGVIAVQQLSGSFNVLRFEVVSSQLHQGVMNHYVHLAVNIA